MGFLTRRMAPLAGSAALVATAACGDILGHDFSVANETQKKATVTVQSFCAHLCDCGGCLADCEASFADLATVATTKGCSPELDAYLGCATATKCSDIAQGCRDDIEGGVHRPRAGKIRRVRLPRVDDALELRA